MRILLFLVQALAAASVGAQSWAWDDGSVPFVPTPDAVVERMLYLAQPKAGERLVDLGSGDGRIVIESAKRFGTTGLGVDLDPELVRLAAENAKHAGVESLARFEVRDLFETDLHGVDVVTMYLLPEVNLKLRPALLALKPGTRIVSHDWDMGEWKPDRSIRMKADSKKIGLRKESDVHLWVVPTDADGLWCGTGNATGTRMTVTQQFQRASGTLSNIRGVYHFEGLIDANRLASTSGDGKISFDISGDDLKVQGADGVFAHLAGTPFKRSCCGSCRDY
jgi:hypothetical protein